MGGQGHISAVLRQITTLPEHTTLAVIVARPARNPLQQGGANYIALFIYYENLVISLYSN
jgi:hypothetical protein